MKYLNKVGVCIKSTDLSVEYQNPTCEKICGNQKGKICDKGCILRLRAETAAANFQARFKLFRGMNIDGDPVDGLVFDESDKVVTLLINAREAVEAQMKILAKYALSVTETQIIKLFLYGKSNKEISAELFISRSTLRTHLNNIYKKLPENVKNDVLAGHFGITK